MPPDRQGVCYAAYSTALHAASAAVTTHSAIFTCCRGLTVAITLRLLEPAALACESWIARGGEMGAWFADAAVPLAAQGGDTAMLIFARRLPRAHSRELHCRFGCQDALSAGESLQLGCVGCLASHHQPASIVVERPPGGAHGATRTSPPIGVTSPATGARPRGLQSDLNRIGIKLRFDSRVDCGPIDTRVYRHLRL